MGFLSKIKNGVNNAASKGKDAVHHAKDEADKLARKAKEKAAKDLQKVKDAKRKADDLAKEKARKIKDKIDEGLKKIKLSPKDAQYFPLLPFKGIMKKALSDRNIPTDNSLSDISNKFLQAVVNESNKKSPIVNVLSGSALVKNKFTKGIMSKSVLAQSFDADEAEYTEEGSEAAKYEKGAKQTKGIIEKIIQWFHERKEKKKAKKEAEEAARLTNQPMPPNYGDLNTPPLTSEEEDIVEKVETVSKTIVEQAEKDATEEEGFSTVEILCGIAGCVIVAAVLIHIFKGSSK